MLDIDKFKNINDTYGHDIGDTILKSVVDQVSAHIREEDILVRFGGEEFLLLLANTTLEEAFILSERISKTLANHTPIENVQVTVSIGLSQCHKDDTDIDMIVKRADTALYDAKASGRNKVMSH